jgi:2-polyprenyl-3-methyl-5-hydroxy-6-metoxy-1,4-benzoquinol methylase
MSRRLEAKDLAYDSIAEEWGSYISNFDTDRRIQVLVHDLLGGSSSIAGKRVLEVGCGLGFFTRELLKWKPARLTSVDISPALVNKLAAAAPNVECLVADALDLDTALGDREFDIVLSSEVIEHTPDPRRAVAQMARHLAPGGRLVLSVPNRRWKWLLAIAQGLRMRKGYEGFENWVSPADLARWVEEDGLTPIAKTGVHTVPWHVSHFLVERLDRALAPGNYSFAVNLAILAERPAGPGASGGGSGSR